MLRTITLSLLLSVGIFLVGCETPALDKEQQYRKYSRIADINRRMMGHDIDALLLLDKPSSLTHYHIYLD